MTNSEKHDILLKLSGTHEVPKACGLVAQLDRVFDYESKGRRFESCRARVEETVESIRVQRFLLFCFHKYFQTFFAKIGVLSHHVSQNEDQKWPQILVA